MNLNKMFKAFNDNPDDMEFRADFYDALTYVVLDVIDKEEQDKALELTKMLNDFEIQAKKDVDKGFFFGLNNVMTIAFQLDAFLTDRNVLIQSLKHTTKAYRELADENGTKREVDFE